MKKIRVWIPLYGFYSYYGGAERQAEKLSRELSKLGVEITIITTKAKEIIREIEGLEGVNIKFLPCFYKGSKPFLKKLNSLIHLAELFVYLLWNNSKYDILQNFFINNHTTVTVLCALITGKPVIIREANVSQSDKNKQNYEKNFIQKILYNLYRKSSAFIALTEEIKEELIEKFKFPPEKIFLIPNGVSLPEKTDRENSRQKLNLAADSIISLIVAKLEKQKNYIQLFDAWKIVIESFPNAILLCLGDGIERNYYEKYIKKIRCENNIILVGTTDNIKDYYQAADLFILPSLYEGMSNALLEAMSYGLPCIASNIRANEFLINHNENGLLFDLNEDNKELANIIVDLIKNSEFKLKLGKNAELKVKNYYICNVAKKYYELYRLLLINTGKFNI